MKPPFPQNVPIFRHYFHFCHRRRPFTSFLKNLRSSSPTGGFGGGDGGGGGGSSKGNAFVLPGATVATILMLGALHARRLYEDKKMEEKRDKGIEFEFQPDIKASFLRILPLRAISRIWGSLTSLEIPVRMRPFVYKAWARAFHSNLEEAALPLEEYATLRDFFVRSLKEGCRPIDHDPHCLISPVDGTVLRFGELKRNGAMIEQVKGHSYSLTALLGASSLRPMNGLYYCVIYLRPGDYHRIHSPVDWNAMVRRHFAGRLYPVNERATRTIRNLYVENERVVLEGLWEEGFMALAAVGATNIGSIELFIEPELQTNKAKKKVMIPTEAAEERVYNPERGGIKLKRGEEVAAFNMGSTVVLVFQAPTGKSPENQSEEFRFCVKEGERVRVGEALGRW